MSANYYGRFIFDDTDEDITDRKTYKELKNKERALKKKAAKKAFKKWK